MACIPQIRSVVNMADSKDTVVSCGDYYEKKPLSVSAMSNENRPPLPNRITPSRENAYWFAHSGVDEETAARNNLKHLDNKEAQLQKEREERIRLFREQQEGERIKRLKELENTFELARKYREQQEEERKRKIEEARIKESERRQQVEERKRQIWEAEQERKEAILRRNLEREARIEARRNAQRNSMSFAFGSSTPRTFDLDLAALGSAPLGCSLMSSVSVKRSEEKEVGVKRATSACSLDRKAEDSDFPLTGDDLTPNRSNNRAASAEPELSIAKQIGIEHMKSDATKACLTMFDENLPFSAGTSFINCSSSRWLTGSGVLVGDDCMSRSMISLSSASRGRRRTDLTPVMPRERSVTPHTVPRAKDSSRSPSRPPSAMSGRSEVSMTSSQSSSVSLRPRPLPRKPRPVSIAGTTLSSVNLNNSWDKQIRSQESNGAPPLGPKPPRPKSSNLEAVVKNPVPIKKPVPPPKTAQILAKAKSHPVPTKDNLRKGVKMPVEVRKELPDESRKELANETRKEFPNEAKKELFPSAPKPAPPAPLPDAKIESPLVQEPASELSETANSNSSDSLEENAIQLPHPTAVEKPAHPSPENEPERETPNQENSVDPESPQAKPRITSEEEAKATLAEKRRLAREQAEREAELERQRQKELRRQEEERKVQEELEQKRQEEEQIRLAELHRKLEEEKLQKAIEEQQQREKEERARKEEEARLRIEREEQDRKAREEAERQRLELEDRLRKEEQERAERKKRVEQIMSRTRNKGNAANNKQMVSPANEGAPAAEMDLLNQSEFLMSSNAADVIINSTVSENSVMLSGNGITPQPNAFGNSATQPLDLDILMTHSNVKNGFHGGSVEQSFVKNNTISSANCVPNRTPHPDAISPSQTNGYSSHEEMSVTSSPEDRSEKSNLSGGLLLNLQSAHPPPPNIIPRGLDDQLIDIGSSTNSSNDNYLIHPDVVNSNLVPSGDPFHTFESNLPKKQETAIADLLS